MSRECIANLVDIYSYIDVRVVIYRFLIFIRVGFLFLIRFFWKLGDYLRV